MSILYETRQLTFGDEIGLPQQSTIREIPAEVGRQCFRILAHLSGISLCSAGLLSQTLECTIEVECVNDF